MRKKKMDVQSLRGKPFTNNNKKTHNKYREFSVSGRNYKTSLKTSR